METRKRNKRRISFSSSESDASQPPRSSKTLRQIQPDSAQVSQASSELSEAPSVTARDDENEDEEEDDDDEEEEVDDAVLVEEEEDEEEEDEEDPDEDEDAIIQSIMQPLVDTSKKTARQKAKETGAVDHLEFLPTDKNAKFKPVLTAEEAALKKSENARKRKNQTEKKLDEEKQETINKLLNKQASKRKGAAKRLTVADTKIEEAEEPTLQVRKSRPLPLGMIRYLSNKEGSTVSLPEELVGHVMTTRVFGAKASV